LIDCLDWVPNKSTCINVCLWGVGTRSFRIHNKPLRNETEFSTFEYEYRKNLSTSTAAKMYLSTSAYSNTLLLKFITVIK